MTIRSLNRIEKRIIGLLLVIFMTSTGARAQDPSFSQFYANPLYLNPAFTGTTLLPKFHINFRDQWPAISNAYVSMSASYDQYVPAINSGFGIIMVGDQAGGGLYKTNSVHALYSYQVNFSNVFAIKVGFQGGYVQKRLDLANVFFFDQIDPVTGFYDSGNNINPTGETGQFDNRTGYVDFSTGILVYSKRFFAGAAAKHVTQPNESLTGNTATLPMRYTAHAGAVIGAEPGKNRGMAVSPNIMYTQQGRFRQLNAGSYLKIDNFFGGLWYRYNINYADAVIILVGAEKGVMKAAYSYDFTIRDLQASTGGAHEVSITVNLSNKERINRKLRYTKSLQCPSLY